MERLRWENAKIGKRVKIVLLGGAFPEQFKSSMLGKIGEIVTIYPYVKEILVEVDGDKAQFSLGCLEEVE